MKQFFTSLTTYIMLLTTFITVIAVWNIPNLYTKVIIYSNVGIKFEVKDIKFKSQLPVWFKVKNDSLYSNRALEQQDVKELTALVSDTCSNSHNYLNAIGELAYKSNNDTKNVKDLILLTLCFVLLGCSARTLYDFIGWKCYKEEPQEMNKWWPWYIFRPLICAPIAALLIVSVRTSFFSNLFVSKDLNSYLVVSFVAGFAIMEFLTMLRRVSKSLFDASDSKSGSGKKDNVTPDTEKGENPAPPPAVTANP